MPLVLPLNSLVLSSSPAGEGLWFLLRGQGEQGRGDTEGETDLVVPGAPGGAPPEGRGVSPFRP